MLLHIITTPIKAVTIICQISIVTGLRNHMIKLPQSEIIKYAPIEIVDIFINEYAVFGFIINPITLVVIIANEVNAKE